MLPTRISATYRPGDLLEGVALRLRKPFGWLSVMAGVIPAFSILVLLSTSGARHTHTNPFKNPSRAGRKSLPMKSLNGGVAVNV